MSLFVYDLVSSCYQNQLRCSFNHCNCRVGGKMGHICQLRLVQSDWNFKPLCWCSRHLSLTASRMHSVFSSRIQRSSFSLRSWCLSFMARVCVVTSFVWVVGLSEPWFKEERDLFKTHKSECTWIETLLKKTKNNHSIHFNIKDAALRQTKTKILQQNSTTKQNVNSPYKYKKQRTQIRLSWSNIDIGYQSNINEKTNNRSFCTW